MHKVAKWIRVQELQLFAWINQKLRNQILDCILTKITHLGGATFTMTTLIAMSIFTSGNLRIASIQSFLSLVISHLPVAIIKKIYRRLRPYLVHPQTQLCIHPLKDHSFPSGHSTAIFASVVPFITFAPLTAFLLIPLAITVSYSRIYIGLHFPLDCIAGAVLGTITSMCVVGFWI
jgi:undecaprenyl-diphosphatase